MPRHKLLAAALLCAWASPALSAEVVCGGPLGPDSSEAALIAAYGADNVVTGQVDGPEGSTVLATTVFPNDPQRSFQVYWWDEDKHASLASFSLPAGDTAPGGLRVGQTVAEIEALNGGPFNISGFDWDYGGFANFGEESNLLNLPGGCYPSVRFAPTKEAPAGTNIDAVEGDIQVPTTEPLLKTLDARVESVWLSYAMPEGMEQEGEGEDEPPAQ
jgi:hypothetical protein